MGLIYEEEFLERLDEVSKYAGNAAAKAGIQMIRDILVPDCQASILSPAEIELMIQYFKNAQHAMREKVTELSTEPLRDMVERIADEYGEIIDILCIVLKRPQETKSWNVKEIFKVEEEKGEREN